LAHSDKDESDAAIADYTEALALNPAHAQSYNNRGREYEKKGDYARSLADFSNAIELKPEYAIAYNNRCWSYYLVADFERALPDCNRSIEINPKNSHSLDSRCAVYVGRQQYDLAISDCSRAIELEKTYGYPYFNRGDALYLKGKMAEALADFRMAESLIPQSDEVYHSKIRVRIREVEARQPSASSPP
jgi:tetratricopeptide (TPR) repeat protein